MLRFLHNFADDNSGATAIEYGLIAAIVGIGIVTSLSSLQSALNATFSSVSNTLTTAN